MDIGAYRKKLQIFLANRLEEREAALLREHLSSCRACQMILEDVQVSFVAPPPVTSEAAQGEWEHSVDGYRIVQRLGKGGMGAVYKAVQLSLERDVALKVLDKELVQNETLIERFMREAKAAARLTHSNIVRVYDFGKSGESYFISMEFIDGQTVYQVIREQGRLDSKRALEIASKVAAALDFASQSGVIHRDIKPENIMLDSSGDVKIADMGLAKEVSVEPGSEGGITMAGERLGTPYYMSPEQIKDTRSVDHRADIYSLGSTLFHMVTGRRPFAGATSLETMELVLNTEAGFTDKEKNHTPPGVRKLIMKMMEKNLRDRYQTWKDVLRNIKAAAAGGGRAPGASRAPGKKPKKKYGHKKR